MKLVKVEDRKLYFKGQELTDVKDWPIFFRVWRRIKWIPWVWGRGS